MAAVEQMMVLFLMMLIGYIAYNKEMISQVTIRHLSSIVVNIANPALILSSVLGDTQNISTEALLLTIPVSFGIYGFLILISLFLPRVFRFPKEDLGTYGAMVVFNNIGFMGFPIIRSMFGSEALLYASPFLFFYNVLIYTYGIRIIGGEKAREESGFSLKKIFNIGIISCIIAFLIFIFKIQLPNFMVTTVEMLSNLTAPLSMMCIGASMATMNLKKLFLDGKMLLFSVVKMIVIPVLAVKFLGLFIQDEWILGISMVVMATPIGSMISMLAQEYDGNFEAVSKGVAITSCLSLFTIPIVAFLVL